MNDIIVFGGTSEGREIGELLRKCNVPALVCVATEYGQSQIAAGGCLRIQRGRLNEGDMKALFIKDKPRAVIDATHPYALEASRNIKNACRACKVRYIRICRERERAGGCETFTDTAALADWLDGESGVIFSTLGAKAAAQLAGIKNFEKRVWVRILPAAQGLAECLSAGFPAKHIICMQGPFSAELNEAMFRAAGAEILATKESGCAGGYAEKIRAARRCGMRVAVLARPAEEEGMTLAEIRRKIEGRGI